jgi:lysozyme family protein
MTTGTFDRAVGIVLDREGGFVRHPLDPGGATKFGITRSTLARARNGPVTVAAVRNLTEGEARAIYRRFYWDVIQADDLPPGIDLALFDFAVNSGPPRAVRTLQEILGVPADGIAGPQTLAAAGAADPRAILHDLSRARLRFLARLTNWRAFGRGWTNRVLSVEREALILVSLISAAKGFSDAGFSDA